MRQTQPPSKPGTGEPDPAGPAPRTWVTWVLVAAIAAIAVVPLATGAADHLEEPFTGADAQAEETVEEVAPGYEPWFDPVYEAPSAEIESGLFALQAAIGAGIIGYVLGVVRTRSRLRREDAAATAPDAPDDSGSGSGSGGPGTAGPAER
ncbi:cobalt/nickel transport protein [Lipingzhangella halophila]|uniref:Cobalt transport protein CbiN n=1 Tax=Lipingzhangella halophila TaxID=1783352 RepID=A0A7W7W463_9ACTN|nr:energy-coupling factor ABC transporter substrate-binding protein [Lipingzhangella halophila]MBB4933268.1 cobalt/nickel transport protein [Lipingzhangella halophila]